jgi:cation-transporting P-type ATPase I
VRPVSAASIERLRDAGIDTIMITGDHPITARAIAEELGLADGLILTGPEVDDLDDDQLAEVLPKVTVFARVTPLHKVRIVRTAQRLGRVVAMTGDGANDAPAIQLAEVGIAVGSRATQAAREAADVIILDDRLEVIVDAIAEGRGPVGLGPRGRRRARRRQPRRDHLHPARQRSSVAARRSTPASCCWSTCSPTSPRRWRWRSGRRTRPSTSSSPRGPSARSARAQPGADLAWRRRRGRRDDHLRDGPADRLTARAQTAGLVALVGAQFGQTIVRSGRDPRVIATGVGSFVLLGAAIQTPGVSSLVGSRPMGPIGWLTGFTGAAIGTAVGVLGPYVEERFSDDEAGPSSRIVERLSDLAPTIPGLLDAGDASPALPPPSSLAPTG